MLLKFTCTVIILLAVCMRCSRAQLDEDIEFTAGAATAAATTLITDDDSTEEATEGVTNRKTEATETETETFPPSTLTTPTTTTDGSDLKEREVEQEQEEFDRLKEKVYEQFLRDEFGYDDYLASPLIASHILAPFKDVSNDTYWKTNWIAVKDLRHYVEKNITEKLESLGTKPWLSIKRIKEELARCVHYRYGTVSEQRFVYDKDMYGMLNMMKFSCLKSGETLYFGMAFARYRFRLKEILLRKEKSYWGRSSRDVTMRDVQKLVEHFSRNFAQKAHKRANNDLRRLGLYTGESEDMQNVTNGLLNLPNGAIDELYTLYPEDDIADVAHQKKERTFAYVAVPVIIRIAILSPHEIQPIVDIYYGDLSDDSQITIELCAKRTCAATDQVTEIQTDTSDHYAFFKDRSLRYDISDNEVLITYASSRPEFQLAKRKRKKNNRIIDIKQDVDEETMNIWHDFLDSQVAHNFYMHHSSILG